MGGGLLDGAQILGDVGRQRRAQILTQQLQVAGDVAQRRAQVVRHRGGERLQVVHRRLQRLRALLHLTLQRLVELAQQLFQPAHLGHVAHQAGRAQRFAVRPAQRRVDHVRPQSRAVGAPHPAGRFALAQQGGAFQRLRGVGRQRMRGVGAVRAVGAQHRRRRVAEQPLGAGGPVADRAVGVEEEDRRIAQRRRQRLPARLLQHQMLILLLQALPQRLLLALALGLGALLRRLVAQQHEQPGHRAVEPVRCERHLPVARAAALLALHHQLAAFAPQRRGHPRQQRVEPVIVQRLLPRQAGRRLRRQVRAQQRLRRRVGAAHAQLRIQHQHAIRQRLQQPPGRGGSPLGGRIRLRGRGRLQRREERGRQVRRPGIARQRLHGSYCSARPAPSRGPCPPRGVRSAAARGAAAARRAPASCRTRRSGAASG